MSLLPLFHDLSNRPVLLVGAGTVARDKLRVLLPTGARLHIVAREAVPEVRDLVDRHALELELRPFAPVDLLGKALVVSATNDPQLNAAIAGMARRQGIPVNAVDDPASCDVFFAATFRRGPLSVALGTEGRFPGLSRCLRETLETLLPEADQDLLEALAALRSELQARLPDPGSRRAALLQLIDTFRTTYLTPEPQP